jgi:hypothetical protein
MEVLAVEYKRHGVVSGTPNSITTVQRGNQIRSSDSGIQGIGGAIRFIGSVPEEQVGARFNVVHLRCDGVSIHVGAGDSELGEIATSQSGFTYPRMSYIK